MESLPVWANGEEMINACSHAVGLGFSLTLFGFFLHDGIKHKDKMRLISNLIFSFAMVFLYANSMIYHALPESNAKFIWRYIDHISIYVLIIGSYAPVCLNLLRNHHGPLILTIVTILGVIGTVLKILYFDGFVYLSLGLYLGMGWAIVFGLKDLKKLAPPGFVKLLFIGGICYSLGIFFFCMDYIFSFHGIFHLFILAGTCCHAVAFYKS